jgi:hypothetical protein
MLQNPTIANSKGFSVDVPSILKKYLEHLTRFPGQINRIDGKEMKYKLPELISSVVITENCTSKMFHKLENTINIHPNLLKLPKIKNIPSWRKLS